MRVNIYSQELTKEWAIVGTEADTGIVYHGIRWFLASPDILHHTADDDDRSAVTFWIPNAESFTPHDLAQILWSMGDAVEALPSVIPND